jgi:hypothetical protein
MDLAQFLVREGGSDARSDRDRVGSHSLSAV